MYAFHNELSWGLATITVQLTYGTYFEKKTRTIVEWGLVGQPYHEVSRLECWLASTRTLPMVVATALDCRRCGSMVPYNT